MRKIHMRRGRWQTAAFEHHHQRRKYHRGFFLILVAFFMYANKSEADFRNEEQRTIEAAAKTLSSVVKIEPELLKTGSGFYISTDTIITNEHVVRYGGETMSITKNNGAKCTAKVGYREEKVDLALLTASCKGDPLTLSENTRVGQSVLLVGNPEGLDFSVTKGIISALRGQYIQVDAKGGHGSSGGAIVNLDGEVMGVTKARYDGNDWAIFGVSVNEVKAFLERSK